MRIEDLVLQLEETNRTLAAVQAANAETKIEFMDVANKLAAALAAVGTVEIPQDLVDAINSTVALASAAKASADELAAIVPGSPAPVAEVPVAEVTGTDAAPVEVV